MENLSGIEMLGYIIVGLVFALLFTYVGYTLGKRETFNEETEELKEIEFAANIED